MMGKRICAVIVVVMVVASTLVEPSKEFGLFNFCGMSEDDLKACKPSVTKPNPVDPPPEECCKALSRADLSCLCSYKNSTFLPSLGIEPDLAFALPSKCSLTSPADC